MNNTDNKFDIDLKFGVKFENKVMEALQGKIEVKTERGLWQKTGNIAIEFECNNKPSGLRVTEAENWVHVLTVNGEVLMYLMFPVKKLKRIANHYYNKGKVISGGDGHRAKMVLIPLNELGDLYDV